MTKHQLKDLLNNWTHEYKFHPERRWRFDHAYVSLKVAVEYEGGIWTGGRHTRGIGYKKDCEKYNAAVKLGWRVLRYTVSHELQEVLADLVEIDYRLLKVEEKDEQTGKS